MSLSLQSINKHIYIHYTEIKAYQQMNYMYIHKHVSTGTPSFNCDYFNNTLLKFKKTKLHVALSLILNLLTIPQYTFVSLNHIESHYTDSVLYTDIYGCT